MHTAWVPIHTHSATPCGPCGPLFVAIDSRRRNRRTWSRWSLTGAVKRGVEEARKSEWQCQYKNRPPIFWFRAAIKIVIFLGDGGFMTCFSHSSKVWMKGFLPSQWYVPVSTLLPVSKVLSFSPPQRSWFPNRIPGKLSHVRRISQGQVFSHSEGSRSRLPKKLKIK